MAVKELKRHLRDWGIHVPTNARVSELMKLLANGCPKHFQK
jgi:hypothetical protein